MKTAILTLLGVTAALPHRAGADCLYGVVLTEGQSGADIGYECRPDIDDATYDGTESVCGPDGEMVETEKQFSCSGTTPYCVQCGPRCYGGALCLPSPELGSWSRICPETCWQDYATATTEPTVDTGSDATETGLGGLIDGTMDAITEAIEGSLALALGGIPPSLTCIGSMETSGKSFQDCCPGPDPADGICTMLWCVDFENIALREDGECNCEKVEAACVQLTPLMSATAGAGDLPLELGDNIVDMCASIDTCCEDGTENAVWGACMNTAKDGGEFITPDIDSLFYGGIPDLGAPAAGGGGTTQTTSTVAAVATAPATEPLADSGGRRYATGVATCLAGSTLASMFV